MSQLSITARPTRLDQVYGCDTIKAMAKEAAKTHNWPTAIALVGKYGTGKSTSAKILAQMMTCTNPDKDGNPCGECLNCKAIISERFNRSTIMIDGGQAGKADLVDTLEAEASTGSIVGGDKVIILEEVQELSQAAKNSMLKLLESPRKGIHWIATTMAPLPRGGFASRFQQYKFDEASSVDVMKYLVQTMKTNEAEPGKSYYDLVLEKSGKTGDEAAKFLFAFIKLIAESSDGSYRSAIQMLDQCITCDVYEPAEMKKKFAMVSEDSSLDAYIDVCNNKKTEKVLNEIINTSDYQKLYAFALNAINDTEVYKAFGEAGFDGRRDAPFAVARAKAMKSAPQYEIFKEAMLSLQGGYFSKAAFTIKMLSCFK